MSEVVFYDGRPVFCDSTTCKDGSLMTEFIHITPNLGKCTIGEFYWHPDHPGNGEYWPIIRYIDGEPVYENPIYCTYNAALGRAKA